MDMDLTGQHRAIAREWSAMDLAIFTCGGPVHSAHSALIKGLLEKPNLERLESHGNQIVGNFIDDSGDALEVKSLVTRCVPPAMLRRVAHLDSTFAPLVVAGDSERAGSALAALRAGFVSALLCDRATCIRILELDDDRERELHPQDELAS